MRKTFIVVLNMEKFHILCQLVPNIIDITPLL